MPRPRKNGTSGKGSEGGEERKGKERMWTHGKMTKEETNSLVRFSCIGQGAICLTFDQLLDLETLPLHEGWRGRDINYLSPYP